MFDEQELNNESLKRAVAVSKCCGQIINCSVHISVGGNALQLA